MEVKAMKMVRIARSNRLPDSLPVVIKLLEDHPVGLNIASMEAEIERQGLWTPGEVRAPRARYHRIHGVLRLLHGRDLVRKEETSGREARWILLPEAFTRQRRKELCEAIRPFVDGCLTLTDSGQLLAELRDLVEDGTLDQMLEERRARARRATGDPLR